VIDILEKNLVRLIIIIFLRIYLHILYLFSLQKFGVQQKEKIASYKSSIDVLTLSATPIPRTLYLALTGFRDAR
jgi:hypothetical protein